MPFCSLPRDFAYVWHALIRGFLNWHQVVPFWIGDVTVREKPELWRWLRSQDHLFNFLHDFHWTKGIKNRYVLVLSCFLPPHHILAVKTQILASPCFLGWEFLCSPQSQHRGRGGEGLQQHKHKLLCPASAGRKTSFFVLPCLPCALMHLPQKGAFVKEANKMIYENSAITGLFCLGIGKIISWWLLQSKYSIQKVHLVCVRNF